MSQLKYCQGPRCHTYDTKDRKKGPKDNKRNETRRRSSFYYLDGNAYSMQCMYDWFNKFGNLAVDHFGRIHEPKRTDASGAWYKDYKWRTTETTGQSRYNHYFVNDLLGERIPITEQQYDNTLITNPKEL